MSSLIKCIVLSPISHPTRKGARVEVGQTIDLTPGQFAKLEKRRCVEVAAAHQIREEAEAKAQAAAEKAKADALKAAEKAKADAEEKAKQERARAEALAKADFDSMDSKALRRLANVLGISDKVDWKKDVDDQREQVRRLTQS